MPYFRQIHHPGGPMGFKKMETNLSFTDISLFNSMEHNRAIARMEQINAIVDWSRIENLLLRSYPVGKSNEGNEAWPPLILMKCLLLEQWFRIDSDPELETQINDRISFKKFLGLSFDQRSPDHSTFSRFRSRLSQDTLRLINHELLSQFAAKGLTINEGIAVDARLVQSASHPISKEKLEKEKKKLERLPKDSWIRRGILLNSPAISNRTGRSVTTFLIMGSKNMLPSIPAMGFSSPRR
jgi:transposase, IS5 family